MAQCDVFPPACTAMTGHAIERNAARHTSAPPTWTRQDRIIESGVNRSSVATINGRYTPTSVRIPNPRPSTTPEATTSASVWMLVRRFRARTPHTSSAIAKNGAFE
ncbi:MAG: hypothetical protein DMF94_12695 [Acidobacteria bacterium]|nr:MAG: hypothetical protein DMF94_12695 [Acidobacteriota bacterium]